MDILDQLGNAKYFSILDLASEYHQISMHDEHKNKIAFSTPYGHFEFNRMPFKFKKTGNVLATNELSAYRNLGTQMSRKSQYVIYGLNLKEHNKRLIQILNRLRGHNLKLQPNKCEFLRKEIPRTHNY